MKINEIADVAVHPAVKKEQEFVNLLQAGENAQDEIIEFILDDRNAANRRLTMLRHLDELLGNVQDSYSEEDLGDFMHDQGPSEWRSELRSALKKYSADAGSYSWSKKHPPGTSYDFSKIDDISDEEMLQLAKDLKIPPYHLEVVDEEQFDDELPTGEYEICDKCFGEGCPECEEGLIDVTGQFKLPDFGDLD